jgi:hypothetical protein
MSRLFIQLEYLLENNLRKGEIITFGYVGMLCETGHCLNYLHLTLEKRLAINVID